MFFNDDGYREPMKQLLLQIIAYNFNVFEQTPPNKFSDISDLLESFYALNTKIVKKIPTAYTNENMDFLKLVDFGKKIKLILYFLTNSLFCSPQRNYTTRNWSYKKIGIVSCNFCKRISKSFEYDKCSPYEG